MDINAERITAIRQVLADFDWEFDDRQYALEKIDRLANEPWPVNA